MAASRQELIQSAVAFLQDPTVSSSPLSKRIAFLESKGLTPQETDEALRAAAVTTTKSTTATAPLNDSRNRFSGRDVSLHHLASSPTLGRYTRPEEIARDWRDWFVMTVIGGTVGMLMYKLAKKYLFPALTPPTQTDLEKAQAALQAKYDEAAAILSTLSNETAALRQDLTHQEQLVQNAITQVNDAVDECIEGEQRRAQDMEKVKQEVDQLKDLLPKVMEKHKNAQTAALGELGSEIKSLKALLVTRTSNTSFSPNTSDMLASSPGPALNRPPGIPAWQMMNGPSMTPKRLNSTRPTPVPQADSVETNEAQEGPAETT